METIKLDNQLPNENNAISQDIKNVSDNGLSLGFLILSIITGIGGCISSRNDAEVVGGDAYNYIISAGRGNAIVGVAVIFAVTSLILAIYNLTKVIIYENRIKK